MTVETDGDSTTCTVEDRALAAIDQMRRRGDSHLSAADLWQQLGLADPQTGRVASADMSAVGRAIQAAVTAGWLTADRGDSAGWDVT